MSAVHVRHWPGDPSRPAVAIHCMMGSGRAFDPMARRLGGKVDLTARYGINDWQSYNTSASATMFRESTDAEDSKSGEFGVTWERPLNERFKLETRLMHEFGSWDGVSTYNVLNNGIV